MKEYKIKKILDLGKFEILDHSFNSETINLIKLKSKKGAKQSKYQLNESVIVFITVIGLLLLFTLIIIKFSSIKLDKEFYSSIEIVIVGVFFLSFNMILSNIMVLKKKFH